MEFDRRKENDTFIKFLMGIVAALTVSGISGAVILYGEIKGMAVDMQTIRQVTVDQYRQVNKRVDRLEMMLFKVPAIEPQSSTQETIEK